MQAIKIKGNRNIQNGFQSRWLCRPKHDTVALLACVTDRTSRVYSYHYIQPCLALGEMNLFHHHWDVSVFYYSYGFWATFN